MVLYRLAKKRHSDDLNGKGAELCGGRWNRPGVPALYLAENISLAVLETIAHCQMINDLHHRVLLSVEVPDGSVKTISLHDLPKEWNSTPWSPFTIDYGTKWLHSSETLVLKAPSAIIPDENIYIINPKHSDSIKVKIITKKIFTPDNRLVLLDH